MKKRVLLISAVAASVAIGIAAAAAFGAGSNGTAPLAAGEAQALQQSQGGAPNTAAALQQPEEEPGQGARRVASAIAAEFGVSEDEVLALHEQGVGFGAMFKLYQLARVQGVTAPSLLTSVPLVNGEPEFAFGERFEVLTDAQKAQLADGPKNLGALVSASARNR